MGTLGGALSHADPNADYPPAILAADAEIEVVGPIGQRTIPASNFFLDFLTSAIEPGEIVTKARVPAPTRGSVGVYEKFARVDGDYATASIAMVLAMTGTTCSSIRVAIGACGPTPVRSLDAEQLMIGTALDAAILARAGQIMAESIDPVDDVRGSAEYRRMLVPRLLSRTVQRALSALRVTVSDPYPVMLTVNGDETVRAVAAQTTHRRAAVRSRPYRNKTWVQSRGLRLLYRVARRRAGSLLPLPGRERLRNERYDGRGSRLCGQTLSGATGVS